MNLVEGLWHRNVGATALLAPTLEFEMRLSADQLSWPVKLQSRRNSPFLLQPSFSCSEGNDFVF
jgi:hypothetical protein